MDSTIILCPLPNMDPSGLNYRDGKRAWDPIMFHNPHAKDEEDDVPKDPNQQFQNEGFPTCEEEEPFYEEENEDKE